MCVCAHIVFSFYLAAVLITTTEAYCSCSLVVIGAIAERSASLTLHTAQSANDIKWTVRVPYEMELHIGRHKWSRHLRPAQRAVEPSRFPAHICNVHKTSCILPFNHYDPPRSATQNARSSPHAIFVFHHRDHAQPTQSTAERHSTHRKTHMNQAVVRAPNSTQQHEKQQHTILHAAFMEAGVRIQSTGGMHS